MTYFHACVGCKNDKETCDEFSAFKGKIAGLGITSVKWKCPDRTDRFHIGQPVFALTTCNYGDGYYESDSVRDYWPAHVIRIAGSKALVYIKPGVDAEFYGEGEAPFEPSNGSNGFCKIPLSRLKFREGTDENICPSCDLPSFAGHRPDYLCDRTLKAHGDGK